MILNYYQAVDLMSSLPLLLSHGDATNIQDTVQKQAIAEDITSEDAEGVYQLWRYASPGIEVNGADFY
jgi:hypothetical protein